MAKGAAVPPTSVTRRYSSAQQLSAKIDLWRLKWKYECKAKPQLVSASETLTTYDKDLYPIVYSILQLLLTLLLSVATADKSCQDYTDRKLRYVHE